MSGLVMGVPGDGQPPAAPAPQAPASSPAQQAVAFLEASMKACLVERDAAIRVALLALVLGEHAVFLGPPGVSKSAMVETLAKRLSVPGDGYFSYLMTKETSQAELFGAYDFAEMKAGRMRRTSQGLVLQRAHIAFLDEAFKANSAILNALLRCLNEGTFDDGSGRPQPVPLRSCFGASNEFPQGDELEALFDRFLFRDVVQPIQSASARLGYLRDCAAGVTAAVRFAFPEAHRITMDAFRVARSEVVPEYRVTAPGGQPTLQQARVSMSNGVLQAFVELVEALAAKGVVMSDRRQGKAVLAVRAHAWIEGRTQVIGRDLRVLRWIAWSSMEERREALAVIEEKVPDLLGAVTAELRIAEAQFAAATQAKAKGQAVPEVEIRAKVQRALHNAKVAMTRIPAADPKESERAGEMLAEVERKLRAFETAALGDGNPTAEGGDPLADALEQIQRQTIGGDPAANAKPARGGRVGVVRARRGGTP